MKTRIGFVSNSSSTSFVLTTCVYPTVRDLAINMMRTRNSDWDEYDDDEVAEMVIKHTETQDDKLFNEIEEMVENRSEDQKELEFMKNSDIDKNTPTAFKTTNYDTYIFKSGNYLFVSTCNNHYYNLNNVIPIFGDGENDAKIEDFRDIYNEFDKNFDSEKFDVRDLVEDLEFSLKYVTEFWWPKINKKFRILRDYKKCPNECGAYGGLVLCDGKLLCPNCDLGLGKYFG